MAAPAESNSASDNAFNRLVSSYTLTFTGASLFTSAGAGGPVQTLPPTLATATGSSPLPPAGIAATRTGEPTASLTSTSISEAGSSGGASMPKNVRNLLIALGCAVGFVLILLTFFVWYRARRKTTGGFLAFCMPKRKTDSYYRQLHSPSHGGWESRNGEASERKPSMSRSDTMTPVSVSPPPRVRPVVAPVPARLNTTFIGRERNNNLVRASLNRHQLSTLDEHSLYEYESEQVPPPAPPVAPPLMPQQSSLPSPINSGVQIATSSPTSHAPTTADAVAPSAPSTPLDPAYAVAPLQPRKLEVPRQSTRSSWTTVSQPATPLPLPSQPENFPFPTDDSVPRFRSVDHWADYQSRIAARDRSMTSGEYSQAFKDRDSTADSLGKRDSNSTIAVFRYHPGEEVPWNRSDAELAIPAVAANSSSSVPPPSAAAAVAGAAVGVPAAAAMGSDQEQTYISYQPFQPPKRMHSARNARGGPRYHYGGPSAVVDRSSQASSDSHASTPPSPPHEGGGTRRIIVDPTTLQKRHESEATVFKYHPGEEVILDRAQKIRSEDLDAYFVPPSPTASR